MLDVNNKGNDVEGGGREEGFPASCFYKLKTALKKKKKIKSINLKIRTKKIYYV